MIKLDIREELSTDHRAVAMDELARWAHKWGTIDGTRTVSKREALAIIRDTLNLPPTRRTKHA